MSEFEAAVLIGPEVRDYPQIQLIHPEFIVGRGKSSSFIISNLMISKTHCIFQKKDGIWTVCDKSTFGTYVNNERLEKDKPSLITDGDMIAFDNGNHFKYVFYTKDVSTNSTKKMRRDENFCLEDWKLEHEMRHPEENRELQDRLEPGNIEREKILQEKLELKQQQCEERRIAEGKLLREKQLLEEKLKEMQNLLAKKNKDQELLSKQLQEKEEQRLRDLEQKDAQTKIMLEELVKEVTEKELVIKIQLAREIQNLQEEKLKIENDIRGTSRKEGESAEHLKRLQEELQKVKTDLSNTEGKMQYLEKELEHITKAKEVASESCLKAKQDMLNNFGELVETELQCSICSELFVSATTLNCTHTFCHYCIVQWLKKKDTCPICRKRIRSQNKSIVVDNFIDRMVENLSVELKNRRQEIVEERQIQELLGPRPKGEPRRGLQRRDRTAISVVGSEDSPNTSSVIYISSTSSSDTESDTSSSYELE